VRTVNNTAYRNSCDASINAGVPVAKGYQPVLGSLSFKLLFRILLRLNNQYLKQNLRVFA